MILFFGQVADTVFAIETAEPLAQADFQKLEWLFGGQKRIDQTTIAKGFIGPRAAMITPWSTNAVEITQNMGIAGIQRIELFHFSEKDKAVFDPMISQYYKICRNT